MNIEIQAKVWDKIAKLWHKYRDRPIPEVVNFLQGKKGKILDLGCGSGRNFIKLDAELYAVDFSSEQLKHAREIARSQTIFSMQQFS